MVQGADEDVDGAMFIGYHARVGTQNAILDHTWSGSIAGFWLNGQAMGEIGINAAVCGHYGVPLLMISGDQTACAEAETLLGPLEQAIVKRAVGRMTAECLSPEVAQQRIYDASRRAVGRLASGDRPKPLVLERPIIATVELTTSEMADGAALLPGARRLEGKRIEVSVQDVVVAYRAMRAALALARS
jgi:D-amino peptidase